MIKALADRCSFLEQCPLSGSKNQFLCTMLKLTVLSAPAEYIFVMINFDDFRRRKFSKDCLRAHMISN